MIIQKINTSVLADVRKFARLPFQLYQHTPQWVPPLAGDMELVMDRKKYPFYQHSDADFFIATQGDQVLGRLAVIHNRLYCDYHQEAVAFLYFFETVDDKTVSKALLDAAVEWAKQRNLKTLIMGRGMIRSHCIGVLVDGFDFRPSLATTYNLPYYGEHIQSYGFEQHSDHLTGRMIKSQQLPDRVFEMADKVKQRGGFWIKTFKSTKEMLPWIPKVDLMHHEAFKNNPGYYPSTHEEFDLLVKNILAIADPRFIKGVMHGEDIAGFILAYPDISAAVQRTHGQIWPLGWLDLWLEKKRSRCLTINAIGLLPQYQGLGANILLYAELEKTIRDYDIQEVQILQVDERNFKSKSDMDTMNVTWCIRHRSYHLYI